LQAEGHVPAHPEILILYGRVCRRMEGRNRILQAIDAVTMLVSEVVRQVRARAGGLRVVFEANWCRHDPEDTPFSRAPSLQTIPFPAKLRGHGFKDYQGPCVCPFALDLTRLLPPPQHLDGPSVQEPPQSTGPGPDLPRATSEGGAVAGGGVRRTVKRRLEHVHMELLVEYALLSRAAGAVDDFQNAALALLELLVFQSKTFYKRHKKQGARSRLRAEFLEVTRC
jgi:hypothetical protein